MKDEHDDIRRRLGRKKVIAFGLAGLFYTMAITSELLFLPQTVTPFYKSLVLSVPCLAGYGCLLLGFIYQAAQSNKEKEPWRYLRKAQLLLSAFLALNILSCFLFSYHFNGFL